MTYTTQNDLLLEKLLEYFKVNNNLDKMLSIINGESRISLRIIDWFVTNYAKKHYTVYDLPNCDTRFKVYVDYKLKLKAYGKTRLDPFCRWERITIPYNDHQYVQTTIGQLNFFKWALENKIIDYIENNYTDIEKDMNMRNSTAKKSVDKTGATGKTTRKVRQELSISAARSIKQEFVEITVVFN